MSEFEPLRREEIAMLKEWSDPPLPVLRLIATVERLEADLAAARTVTRLLAAWWVRDEMEPMSDDERAWLDSCREPDESGDLYVRPLR